jgi:hypothetical protein
VNMGQKQGANLMTKQKQSVIKSRGKEGGKEGGQYRPEVLSTLLSTTERIVQQIDSVE